MLDVILLVIAILAYMGLLCTLVIKFPKQFDNVATIGGAVVLALAVLFIAYGVNSQCPNESVYRYCAPKDRAPI